MCLKNSVFITSLFWEGSNFYTSLKETVDNLEDAIKNIVWCQRCITLLKWYKAISANYLVKVKRH